jgi:glycosyltransferase involved in cell wall biosynthesis
MRSLSKRPELKMSAVVLNEGRLAEELQECCRDVCIIPERQRSFWQIVAESREFVRARNVQIVHAHRYKENIIGALLAFKERRLKLVKTQHGQTETFPGLAGAKQWLAHTADRLTMRYAGDVVISVSSHLTGYLKKYVSQDRIVVIPNGVDLARLRCNLSRAQAKEHLGIAEQVPVVGFVGRLERVKRLDIFVQTAGEILKQIPTARFVITGSGREEMSLRSLISDLELQDHFILLGYQRDSAAMLRAMDVLLITSDHEGLPMVLLEAMALGTAVVARKVGGIAEVLTDRQTGFLVDDQSPEALSGACVEALKNTKKTEDVVCAARKLIETTFLAEQNGERVLELYRSIVGN